MTLKYNQGQWKWHEWLKLNEHYYQAKFGIYHIYSVRENYNVKVLATYRPAGQTLIITSIHIFHGCQKNGILSTICQDNTLKKITSISIATKSFLQSGHGTLRRLQVFWTCSSKSRRSKTFPHLWGQGTRVSGHSFWWACKQISNVNQKMNGPSDTLNYGHYLMWRRLCLM